MHATIIIAVLSIGCTLATNAMIIAAEVVDKDDRGIVQDRYHTDANGKRTGAYQSYYANGKPHEKGSYQHDQKQGSWTTYDANGKIEIVEQFQNGQRNGPYVRNVDGHLRIKARYAKDGLITPLTVYGKNGHAERQIEYPHSQSEVTKILTLLLAPVSGPVLSDPASLKPPYHAGMVAISVQDQALHALQAIRMLCGAPWEDMTLDKQASDLAQHAATLAAVQGFSHQPHQPGDMDDAFYAAAVEGTNSCLYWAHQEPDGVVRAMRDWLTDPAPELNHRRFLLNTVMLRIGIGFVPPHAMLDILDKSRANVPNWDMVCYPGSGYFPQQMMTSDARWSVMLNPAVYTRVDPAQVTVSLHLMDDAYGLADEVEIDGLTVLPASNQPMTPVVIFRPKLSNYDGKRIWVELRLGPDGAQQQLVNYVVDCVPIHLPAPSPLFFRP